MDFEQLQSYKFVSVHPFCCTETRKLLKMLPKLFENHYTEIIHDPIRRINFSQKVQIGSIEERIYESVQDIERNIAEHDKYCINYIPLFNIFWMQQYKKVSPYLLKAATELFTKIDLLVLLIREDMLGRNGEPSWFTQLDNVKSLEAKISPGMFSLIYDNNIKYISMNRLLTIAQERKLW